MSEKILNKISLILICYNSSSKLKKFLKNIPKQTKVFLIDNSKDYSLKKLFSNQKNIKMHKMSNGKIINVKNNVKQICRSRKNIF